MLLVTVPCEKIGLGAVGIERMARQPHALEDFQDLLFKCRCPLGLWHLALPGRLSISGSQDRQFPDGSLLPDTPKVIFRLTLHPEPG